MLADKVRKQSLKKATSPEQLDAMLKVATPKGWYAALFLVGALTAGLVWSVFASAPVKVTGKGILLAGGKVLAVSATSPGIAGEPRVTPGSVVQKGDILLDVSLPEIEAQIVEAQFRETQLGLKLEELTRQSKKSAAVLAAQHAEEARHTAERIAQSELAETRLAAELANRQALLEKGFATTSSVEEAGGRLDEVRRNLADARIAQTTLVARQQRELQQRDADLSQARFDYNAAALKLQQLKKSNETDRALRAPADGVLLEVLVSERDPLSAGETVFELMPTTKSTDGAVNLEGVIYLSSDQAYKLEIGDAVQIVPSSVQLERDGYMIGEVKSVEPVPATATGIQNKLRNEDLARNMLKDGPVNEVLVALQADPNATHGLRWSTKNGAAFDIKSGTTATANFIVDRKRILSFVIPRIDQYLPAISAAHAAPKPLEGQVGELAN